VRAVGALGRAGALRPLAATLLIVAACVAYQLWLSAGGARKLEAAEIAPGARGGYEVLVNFAPEGFHVTRMQAIGRVMEVRERSVFLLDASPADMRALAREYWVADVKPWAGR
jgi:hypothetical protein